MRYYLIAGEASGDLHGSNLIHGIRKADPEAVFRFWGGDKMAEIGLTNHNQPSAMRQLLVISAHSMLQ